MPSEDEIFHRIMDAAANATPPTEDILSPARVREMQEQVEGWANFLPAPPLYISRDHLEGWFADFRRWEDEGGE